MAICSGGSRIFPDVWAWTLRGGGVPTYDFAKFSQKLHEFERIWTPRGAHPSRPLRSATDLYWNIMIFSSLETSPKATTKISPHLLIYIHMLQFLFQGCALFPGFVQNFSDRQILWSLCSVVFYVLTLKLPIQTTISVSPELSVSLSSHEKCQNFGKTSTPLDQFEITDTLVSWYTLSIFIPENLVVD